MPLTFDFQTVKRLVLLAAEKGYEAKSNGENLETLKRNIEHWFNDARSVNKRGGHA
jgi:hypothetical protein